MQFGEFKGIMKYQYSNPCPACSPKEIKKIGGGTVVTYLGEPDYQVGFDWMDSDDGTEMHSFVDIVCENCGKGRTYYFRWRGQLIADNKLKRYPPNIEGWLLALDQYEIDRSESHSIEFEEIGGEIIMVETYENDKHKLRFESVMFANEEFNEEVL